MVEALVVACLLGGGSLAARTAGLRGVAVPALGLLMGVGLFLTIALLQVVSPLPTTPVFTLALTLLLPLGWWGWARRAGADTELSWRAAAMVAGVALGLVVFLRTVHLTTWHGDSVFYLLVGRALSTGTFYGAMTNEFFEKRPLGVPALHSASALHGEYYVASVTPLIALALLVSLVWLFHQALGHELPRNTFALYAVLGVTVLVSTSRFVFHAFYLNGHLLTGAMVLVAAGSLWLLARGDARQLPLVMLVLAATATVVLTRAEGALTILIVLIPAVLAPTIERRVRGALVAWLGVVMIAWYGFGLWVSTATGANVSLSTLAQFAVGIALVLSAPLVGARWLDQRRRLLLVVAELGLWSALAALTVANPSLSVRSIAATIENQSGAGKWGLTIVAVAAMVVGIVSALRVADHSTLRFPVTTFVPFVLVLAHLREGAYRVGPFDSLNRMWMQVLPLAMLFVMVAFSTGEWKPWWRRLFRLPSRSRTVRESPLP